MSHVLRTPVPAAIATAGHSMSYPPDTTLFRTGEAVDALFLIEEGIVTLRQDRTVGGEVKPTTIGHRTVGSLLGVVPAVAGERHAFTAFSPRPLRLRAIARAEFDRLRCQPDVAGWLPWLLARESHEHLATAAMLACRSAEERLLEYVKIIIRLGCSRYRDTYRLPIRLTHESVGQAIGISREHVGRVLCALEEKGILASDKGWAVIPAGSALYPAARDWATLVVRR